MVDLYLEYCAQFRSPHLEKDIVRTREGTQMGNKDDHWYGRCDILRVSRGCCEYFPCFPRVIKRGCLARTTEHLRHSFSYGSQCLCPQAHLASGVRSMASFLPCSHIQASQVVQVIVRVGHHPSVLADPLAQKALLELQHSQLWPLFSGWVPQPKAH